ncbi:hypothetical protein F4561_004633 [Lipingzhangella halophila]|uniref:DUF3592 domain-containing protein n=1 Tax=Lipingzhangella halophila TaxID=1783352 RepID=A0A7W7RKR4_9ACTN|nr:DUF3592 domain-containing protein [Lipingzhangella halophila]MBB4933813.1 hypothetical protein [Lipingzhangella halophila]
MANIYPLFPILSGLLVLGYLGRYVARFLFIARYGASTEGQIVGYQETNTAARMIVRFETLDGEEVHAKHASTAWTASRYGDVVTVSYNPDRPEEAHIVRTRWQSHWVEWMFAAMGASLLVIGVYLAYLQWS